MRLSEQQGHVITRVTWRDAPPLAQQQAWRALWQRLLGAQSLEKQKPQDGDPGATTATVASGAPFLSEYKNDNTAFPESK